MIQMIMLPPELRLVCDPCLSIVDFRGIYSTRMEACL